nr:FAR1 DNA binding domain-containing protein [Tanacetum cinerariifolium]
IPETYIHRRWTKEALPAYFLEKRYIYGPCIEETDRLVAEVHATIEDYVGLLRSNTDRLTQFLTTVKEMKKQLEVEMQSSNYDNNKEALYADLLGVTVPEQVDVDEVYECDEDTASGEDNSSDEDTSADVESDED